MKSINLIAAQFSFLLLGLSSCKWDGVNASSEFPSCIPDRTKKDMNKVKVKDLETVIVQSETMSHGIVEPIFLIKYSKVPTGFLSACSLPEEFNQDGLKVKLSGTIYIHKKIHLMNTNSVPIELTRIGKISN